MTNKSQRKSQSFSASASTGEDSRGSHDDLGSAKPSGNQGNLGGANGKPDEVTKLERRVLAHERILQALIGHLADDDPEILAQLKLRFGSGHNLGEYEQSYVSTDHYGDHFIRSIELEVNWRNQT